MNTINLPVVQTEVIEFSMATDSRIKNRIYVFVYSLFICAFVAT